MTQESAPGAKPREWAPGAKPREWATAALGACLRVLGHDDVALGRPLVEVREAWLDDGIAMCVIYRHVWFPEGDLGIRRTFEDDLDAEEEEELDNDPDRFGLRVAMDDIQEPLGSVATRLRVDDAGVHWWGDLGEELPRQPR